MADEKPDQKPKKSGAKVVERGRSAEVVALKREFPPLRQPERLNDADAIRLIG